MHQLSKIKLIMLSPCHLVVKNVYICIAPYHSYHPLCILYIYLCAHAYRIDRGSDPAGVQTRRRGDPTGNPTAGGSWRRRIGLGGVARVPWPPTLSLLERQAPKHSKPPIFYKYQLEFFMFDALSCRSCSETLDAYNLLVQKYIPWTLCRSRIEYTLSHA